MRDKAVVLSVTERAILVSPLLTNTCISCAESSCSKRGRSFPVDNPQKFPVRAGDVVSVAAKKSVAAFQGLFALFFPLAAAVAGFFFAPPSDGLQALGVLAGLAAAVAVVLASSALTAKRVARAEISGVIS